jgi:hypothetical protein
MRLRPNDRVLTCRRQGIARGITVEYYIGDLGGHSSLGAQAWPRTMRNHIRPGRPLASPQ